MVWLRVKRYNVCVHEFSHDFPNSTCFPWSYMTAVGNIAMHCRAWCGLELLSWGLQTLPSLFPKARMAPVCIISTSYSMWSGANIPPSVISDWENGVCKEKHVKTQEDIQKSRNLFWRQFIEDTLLTGLIRIVSGFLPAALVLPLNMSSYAFHWGVTWYAWMNTTNTTTKHISGTSTAVKSAA